MGTQYICVGGQIFPRILLLLCVCVSVSFLNNRCRKNYKTTYKFRNMQCNFQIAFLTAVILYCAEVCLLSSRDGLAIYIAKRERLSHKTAGTNLIHFFPLTTKLQSCQHDEQEYEILVSAWIMGRVTHQFCFIPQYFLRHWLLICAFRWWGMVSKWRRPTTLATAGPTGQVEGHIHCDPGSVGQLWLGHSLPAAVQWLWTNLETI